MKQLAKSVLEHVAPRLLYVYQIHRQRRQEAEIRLLSRFCKKGAISIDVGANLGLYSYYMLQHSAGVVAFEPLKEMQQRLTKHFGKRISLYPVALSDKHGQCEIRLPRGNASWATVEQNNTLSLADDVEVLSYAVPTCRLDDYKFKNIAVIKIDVEGHEEAVLRGALETITLEKPTLIIEIEERHNQGAIGRIDAMLAGLGYRGYFLEKQNLTPLERFDAERDQPINNVGAQGKVGRYINNFIFMSQDMDRAHA